MLLDSKKNVKTKLAKIKVRGEQLGIKMKKNFAGEIKKVEHMRFVLRKSIDLGLINLNKEVKLIE